MDDSADPDDVRSAVMDDDEPLAALRRAFGPPWEFGRLEGGRIWARRGGYRVTGEDAGSVGRAIVEWMTFTGVTGGRLRKG